jgi:hypothetical protein
MFALGLVAVLHGAACSSSRPGLFRPSVPPAAYFFGATLADMEAAEGQLVLYEAGATAATLDMETFLPTLPLDVSPKDPWAAAFVRGHNDRVRHLQKSAPASRPIPADVL